MAEMSLGRIFGWLADEDPDYVCIVHEGRSVTRRELELRSNRLARAYEHLGVGQDHMVTIALPNSVEFFEACVATWKLGATPQPVSAKLPTRERQAIVALARPALVVGAASEDPNIPSLDAGYEPDPTLSDGPLPDRTAKHWKAPTSGGSTGQPKLIVDAKPGVADPEEQSMKLVQLIPGPLYHNAPFSFSMMCLRAGGRIILMTRFDAEEALGLMDTHRVQFVVMVPTMMQRIWRLGAEVRDRYDLSALGRLFHMAAPCPAWLKDAWIQWLGPERVDELYGGTEAQGFTVITGPEWLEHRGSVGKPQGGCEMRILDADGKPLPAGEVGEVFMRPAGGQGSTYHYIGAEARSRDGWESLGDMGYMDADGYLYLADRQGDMILSGGANIYPAEVEAAIDAHPAVRSSAAIGLPDEDMGQRVHAIVDIADGVLEEEALRAHLTDQLVRYKIPRSFEFVRETLRDDAGKLRRAGLRQERMERG